ncbi:hypothetical protein TRVL_00730 [Trypanosoma vivax]|nr:hypothetical protein TRVL_00730 [Trypanosoma vivax]
MRSAEAFPTTKVCDAKTCENRDEYKNSSDGSTFRNKNTVVLENKSDFVVSTCNAEVKGRQVLSNMLFHSMLQRTHTQPSFKKLTHQGLHAGSHTGAGNCKCG